MVCRVEENKNHQVCKVEQWMKQVFCSIVVYKLCARRGKHGIPGVLNFRERDLSHLAYTFLDISGAEWEVKH